MEAEALKNLTILYVEDDQNVRQNAVEYLKRYCKSVLEAKDGKEAIAVWRDARPDVIITDISMPRLNGLDMARYIRSEDAGVQIIIATAYSDTDYLMQAVELQLVKYLVKPITKEKLMSALEKSTKQITDKSKFTLRLSDECRYNAYTKTVVCGDDQMQLTRNESLFLDLLAYHRTRVVHYEEIENAVWPDVGMSQDAIRSLVRSLRKKLPDNAIRNVSGVGYKLDVPGTEDVGRP